MSTIITRNTKKGFEQFKQLDVLSIQQCFDKYRLQGIPKAGLHKHEGFWIELGEICVKENLFSEALTAFSLALRCSSNSAVKKKLRIELARIYSLHVDAYIKQKRFDEAVSYVETMDLPGEAKDRFHARILFKMDRCREAISVYEKYLNKYKNEDQLHLCEVYRNFLLCLFQTGQKGIDYWLTSAVEQCPDDPTIIRYYLIFLLDQKRFEEIENRAFHTSIKLEYTDSMSAEMKRSLKVDAEYVKNYYQLACSINQNSKDPLFEVETYYLNDDWFLSKFMVQCANTGAWVILEKLSGALRAQETQKNSFSDEYLNTLSSISCFNGGEFEKCVELAKPYFEDDIYIFDVWNTLWRGYVQCNEIDKALEVVGQLNKRKAKFDVPLLWECSLLERKGNYSMAAKGYIKYMRRHPKEIRLYLNIVKAYILDKNFDQARRFIHVYNEVCMGRMIRTTVPRGFKQWYQAQLEAGFDCLLYAERIQDAELYLHDLKENKSFISEFIVNSRLIIEKNIFMTNKDKGAAYNPDTIPANILNFFSESKIDISVLPGPAVWELVEAERRIADSSAVHHTPEVISYMKVIEIILRERVFEVFKQQFNDYYSSYSKESDDERNKRLQQFLHYNYTVELGTMARILQFCAEVANGNAHGYIVQLRNFIVDDLKLPVLLSKEFLEQLVLYINKYRNQSVHKEIFGIDEAKNVRAKCYEVVSILK